MSVDSDLFLNTTCLDVVVKEIGRKVFHEDPDTAQDPPKTGHAMYSLKANMRWDEDVNTSSGERTFVVLTKLDLMDKGTNVVD
ncbi:hypothetical protein IFM89_037365, partial [Coptis chinensis]